MKKKDIGILAVLILLLLMWPTLGPMLQHRFFPREEYTGPPPSVPLEETSGRDAPDASDAQAVASADPSLEAASLPVQSPEQTSLLTNDAVSITFSSHGAAVNGAVMQRYNRTLDPADGPVELVFTNRRSLAYRGLPGLGEDGDFTIRPGETPRSLELEGTGVSGVVLTRKISLDENYMLRILDTFDNPTPQPVILPDHRIQLGFMVENASGKSLYVPYSLGVDALQYGGDGVAYLGKKVIPKALKQSGDVVIEGSLHAPVDWMAAKSRFFAQILNPDEGADDCIWQATRSDVKSKVVSSVTAELALSGAAIPPGETFGRLYTCYIGPKKYSVIREYRRHQEAVMNFGMFTPICKFLLWMLNFMHDKLWPHNYGLATILLTVFIRVLFWPITHKGTESMRRMQEIQPLMQELREKHKDNPQKQQQELFALYKEHKVNPVGGCLPMLIQIPVFFALFVVLRSAIELRFASFLWISDLTQPEGLLKGVLPFGGLNLLPIVMSLMMIWQQKIMPTSADPRQAKIMQFMPVMMLFMFYPAPSGLALYWTTNQGLMIAQQYFYKRRKDREAAEADAGSPAAKTTEARPRNARKTRKGKG